MQIDKSLTYIDNVQKYYVQKYQVMILTWQLMLMVK
jgi:hypothetical protein